MTSLSLTWRPEIPGAQVPNSPVLDNLEAGRRRAVDAPVQVAHVIAFLNRESSVVRAYQLNGLAGWTLDVLLGSLAYVESLFLAGWIVPLATARPGRGDGRLEQSQFITLATIARPPKLLRVLRICQEDFWGFGLSLVYHATSGVDLLCLDRSNKRINQLA